MRRSYPLLSLTVAASLICAPVLIPTPAEAAPLGFVAPAQDDPVIAEAQSLYEQGKDKFETAEYEDALVLWKKAFEILPDGDETRGMRHALVYNIANAHSQAYEVSRNPTHLRKAKILLENYRAQHLELYGDDKDAVKERSEVDDRIAEIDKQIADSEAAGETATPLASDSGGETGGGETGEGGGEGGGEQAMPQPTPKPLTPRQQWDKDIKADPELGPKWEKGQKRVVGGAVLVGIGSIFALISVPFFIGAAQPVAEDDFGFSALGKGLLWGGGGFFAVVGLGLLIPGGILIGTGAKARKDVLTAKPRPVSFAPTLLPRGGGLSATLRF